MGILLIDNSLILLSLSSANNFWVQMRGGPKQLLAPNDDFLHIIWENI